MSSKKTQLLEQLPDRPLRMAEARSVAFAMEAMSLSRWTYTGEDGEKEVWFFAIHLAGTDGPGGPVLAFSWDDSKGWDADVLAKQVRDGEFQEVIDRARGHFDVEALEDRAVAYDAKTGEVQDSWRTDDGE